MLSCLLRCRLVVGFCSVMLLACSVSTLDDVFAPDESRPLKPEELTELGLSPALLVALPRGATTPVTRLFDEHSEYESEFVGFTFEVASSAADLTVHGLRRVLARQSSSAEGAAGPLVFRVLEPGSTASRIGVLASGHGISEAFAHFDGPVWLAPDDALVERWPLEAGLRLHALGPSAIEFEVDRVPESPEQLIAALLELWRGDEPDEKDERQSEIWANDLRHMRRVRLTFQGESVH